MAPRGWACSIACQIFKEGETWIKTKMARPLSIFSGGYWLYFAALCSWAVLEGFCKRSVGWHLGGGFFKGLCYALVKGLLKRIPFFDILFSVTAVEERERKARLLQNTCHTRQAGLCFCHSCTVRPFSTQNQEDTTVCLFNSLIALLFCSVIKRC